MSHAARAGDCHNTLFLVTRGKQKVQVQKKEISVFEKKKMLVTPILVTPLPVAPLCVLLTTCLKMVCLSRNVLCFQLTGTGEPHRKLSGSHEHKNCRQN